MNYTITTKRFVKTDSIGNIIYNIPLNNEVKINANTILFSEHVNSILFASYSDFFQLTDASGNVFTKVELPTFNDFIEKIKSNFANNN